MAANGTDNWASLAVRWKPADENGLQQTAVDSARAMVAEVNTIAPFAQAESIHDLACGNCVVMDEILRAHGSELPPSTELLATDKSPSMVAQAAERQKEAVQQGNSEWSKLRTKTLDACDMKEIDDNTFTHILGGNMLYAVPDYKATLSEVKRTLKPGGIFAYSVNAVAPWISILRLITQVRPDKVTPYPPDIWHSSESCEDILKEGRFADVQSKTIDVDFRFDSFEGVVDMLLEILPFMKRILPGMTTEEIQKSKDLMVEHLKKESADKVMKGKGVIVTGKK